MPLVIHKDYIMNFRSEDNQKNGLAIHLLWRDDWVLEIQARLKRFDEIICPSPDYLKFIVPSH